MLDSPKKIGIGSFDPILVAAASIPMLAIILVILFAFVLSRNPLPSPVSYINGDTYYLGATLYSPVYQNGRTTLCPDTDRQELSGEVTFNVTERTAIDAYYAIRRPPGYPGDIGLAQAYGPLLPMITGHPESITVPYAVPRMVGPLLFTIPVPKLIAGPWILEVTSRDGVRGTNSFVIPFDVDAETCASASVRS